MICARFVISFLIPVLVLPAAAFGDEIAASPQFGVLLLRRGQLLEGKVTVAGDRYLVTVSQSGQVYVPVADVECRGRSRDDIYRQKASQIANGSFEEHLVLADWCARHELARQAVKQLSLAASLRPNDPRLTVVERRLQAATATSGRSPTVSAPPAVSAAELQQRIEQLPPGTMETFTSTIQPILLNSCATGACHGPNSKVSYQLLRPILGRPLTQRFTQRNLFATLEQLDPNAPEQSKLLRVLAENHGGAVNSFRVGHTAQYEHVVEWVKQAASQTPDRRPARLETNADSLLQTSQQRPPSWSSQDFAETGNTLAETDPYDPDVFNRQFAPEK